MWETIQAIAASEAAIVLYIALVLFIWRHLKIRFDWDTERWEGIISHAFLVAEKSGLHDLGGEGKLKFALAEFSREYQETWDKEPSIKDLKDASLDLSRLAMEHKLNRENQTGTSVTVSAPSGV